MDERTDTPKSGGGDSVEIRPGLPESVCDLLPGLPPASCPLVPSSPQCWSLLPWLPVTLRLEADTLGSLDPFHSLPSPAEAPLPHPPVQWKGRKSHWAHVFMLPPSQGTVTFQGSEKPFLVPSGADSAWSLHESSLEEGGGNQPQRKRKNSAVTKS